MSRFAGLNSLPYSMGERTQAQAGLAEGAAQPEQLPGAAASAPAPAPAPASNVTMQERAALIADMQRQNMSSPAIYQQLEAMGLLRSEEPAPVMEPEADRPGFMENVGAGARSIGELGASGVGTMLSVAGFDDAGQSVRTAGETLFGMSEEDAARHAQAYEDSNFGQKVKSAAAQGAPSFATAIAGGWAGAKTGAAMGSVVPGIGTAAGGKIGALVGSMTAILPMAVGSAREAAIQGGADPDDPTVERETLATGVATSVIEGLVPARLGKMLEGPVKGIARETLGRAGAKAATIYGLGEGIANVSARTLEMMVFTPEIREAMTEGEVQDLLPLVREHYGEQAAVDFAAGAILGGSVGGGAATLQQNRANAERKRDVEVLAKAAEEGGLTIADLETATQDARAPVVARGAQELKAAQDQVQQAEATLAAVQETGDADAVSQAESNLQSALTQADQAFDGVIPVLGGLDSAGVRTREAQVTERAKTNLVEADLATADGLEQLSNREVQQLAQDYDTARTRAEDARAALDGPDMFDTARREEAQRELRDAETDLQKVSDRIRIKTGRDTEESIATRQRVEAESADYEAAVQRQYDRRFADLEAAGDTEGVRREARKIMRADRRNPDRGLQNEIRKLERELDRASTVEEINAIESTIAQKRSRLGRRAPLVAAAQRALDAADTREAEATVQGESPADATAGTAASDATPGTQAGQVAPEPAAPAMDATAAQPETDAAVASTAAAPEPSPPPEPSPRPQTGTTADDTRLSRAQEVQAAGPEARRAVGATPQATPTEIEAAGAAPETVQAERQARADVGLDPDATPDQLAQAIQQQQDQNQQARTDPEIQAVRQREADEAAAPARPDGAPALRTDGTEANPRPQAGTIADDARLARVQQAHADGADARRAAGVGAQARPSALEAAGAAPETVQAERQARLDAGVRLNATPAQLARAIQQQQEQNQQARTDPEIQAVRQQETETPAATAPEGAAPAATAPEGAAPAATAPEGAAPAPRTRAQTRQEAQADADTAARQAELDRQARDQRAVQMEPAKREAPQGIAYYTDMTDVFGRRSATLKQAREFVLEQGARTGNEYYVAFDSATGEVLGAGTVNAPNRVVPSRAFYSKVQNPDARVTMVHNHPAGSSLSSTDLAFLYTIPADVTVVAISPDGFTFTASPTPEGRQFFDRSDMPRLARNVRDATRESYNAVVQAHVGEGLITLAPDGTVPSDDAAAIWQSVTRATNRALARHGFTRYRETGAPQNLTSRERTAYDRGITHAAKAIRNAYDLSARGIKRPTGTRSGDVSGSRAVRPRRSGVARDRGRDTPETGGGFSEATDRVAGRRGDVRGQPGRGETSGRGSPESRPPRPGERIDGLTPVEVFTTPDGVDVYEVADPGGFTQRVEVAKEALGPVGAQVGAEPGQRQFLFNDGMTGFALDGDNIISVFTHPEAPSGAVATILPVATAQGGRRLDAFDTFLPGLYARHGFRAVARLGFDREFAPEGWDYDFFTDQFGNSDPDITFMVHDPDNASADTNNRVTDYDDAVAAQDAALAEFGEAAPPADFTSVEIQRGQRLGRNPWRDVTAEIGESASGAEADAFVLEKGGENVEYSVVTDQTGRVISAGTNGSPYGVTGSDAFARAHRENVGPIRLTHNHPVAQTLSEADIRVLLTSASPMDMTAVHRNGARWNATRGPVAERMEARDIRQAVMVADDAAYATAPRDTSDLNRNRVAAEARNRALHDAEMIVYTSEGDTFPTNLNTALETAHAAARDAIESNQAFRNARDDRGTAQPGAGAADAEGAARPEPVRAGRPGPDQADRAAGGADSDAAAPVREKFFGPDGTPGFGEAAPEVRPNQLLQSEAFKRWFGDSKAVDMNGNPLLLHHGTTVGGFNTFEPGGSGIFFAASRRMAESYSRSTATITRSMVEGDEAAPSEVLLDPDWQDQNNLAIEEAGRWVAPARLLDEGVSPAGMWWQMSFGDTTPTRARLSQSEIQEGVSQGVFDQGQVDAATIEPYYEVQRTRDEDTGEPTVEIPADRGATLADVEAHLQNDPDVLMPAPLGGEMDGVYEVYLSIENPLVVDFDGRGWAEGPHTGYWVHGPGFETVVSFADHDGDVVAAREQAQAIATEMEAETGSPFRVDEHAEYQSTDAAAQAAAEEGYDGVIFRNVVDYGAYGVGPANDVFVAFEPEQVKSAKENVGRFDPTDPSIFAEHFAPKFQQANKSIADSMRATQHQLEVPAWLDVKTDNGQAFKDMLDKAKTPMSSTKAALKWVEQRAINALTPIRDLELDTRGQLGVGMDSAFKSAEIAMNDAGRNESLMFYGAAKLGENGEFRVAEGTIGIRQMLEKIGTGQELINWMRYMGARRAKEIRAKGLKTPLTDKDISDGLALESDKFKEVAQDWKRFNDANVDFLVETGRISRALAGALKQDAAYIPFYRSEDATDGVPDLFDEAGIKRAVRARGQGKQLTSRDPGIKRMKGGETLKIDNLVENMIKNSQAMVSAGMRNRAANLSFDMMHDAGYVRIEPAQKQAADGSYVQRAIPKDAVRMWRDGQESFVVPETADAIPLVVALGGLDPVRLRGISAAMAKIGAFFRQSITLSPAFVVRNMIRDAFSTGVLFSGKNLTMENNMFRGFMSSLRGSASRQAFSAMSGMGDFKFGGRDIGLGKNDLMMEFGIQPKTAGYRFRQVVNVFERAGTASELSNRIAIYDALVKDGMRPDEAAYQSLTIVNYGRKGSNHILRHLMPMVPFLNARIQGISRIAEDAVAKRGPERRRALARLALNGSVMMTFSAALWGWNNEDPERRRQYKDEPLHRRLNYHIIYADDRKIMIPKAFEIGTLFGTIPELFMEAAVNQNTDELGQAGVQTLVNTFSFNPIPQAMLPALEVIADYNAFTGRPIEGTRLSSLLREDRLTPRTTTLAVGLARSGFGGFTGLSPAAIDHLLHGYGGVVYSSLATITDTVAGEMGLVPERPEGVFGTTPAISPMLETTFQSMFKDAEADPASRYIEDFYRTRDAITQIYRSAREAALVGDVERARHLLERAPATEGAYRLVNKAGTRLSELNTEMRNTRRDPNLGAQEKTRILKPLIRERNRISAQVMELIGELEEKQGASFRRAAR